MSIDLFAMAQAGHQEEAVPTSRPVAKSMPHADDAGTRADPYCRDERLRFLRIDDATRSVLKEFRASIEARLPAILGELYDHIRQSPNLARMFGNEADMARARTAQLQHWLRLFSGQFDDAYMASVCEVGRAHSRIGLEPRWYIGAYSFVMTRLLDEARAIYGGQWRPGPARRKLAVLHGALVKAIMLDMDLAISIYLEEEQTAHQRSIDRLSDAFSVSILGIVETVTAHAGQLRSEADVMTTMAGEATQRTQAVASASLEASANVQAVATATEQLSASIHEISAHLARQTEISAAAKSDAEQTDAIVHELAGAVQRIGEVVGLINRIAEQTNLLALNAAIEASRAGEAGRGFAVVAHEVKALASQTAHATGDIRKLVDGIQTVTGRAVGAIRNVVGVIRQLDEATSAIASAVEEQSAATHSIAHSTQQAAQGTDMVTRHIGGITQVAAQTDEYAQATFRMAGILLGQSQHLSLEVAAFVGRIRAA